MDITKAWIEFVSEVVIHEPITAIAQERKFMDNILFTIPGEVWEQGYSHSFDDLGYSGKSESKMKQLIRNYYNEQSVESANKVICERGGQEITSVGVSTLGMEKKKSTQGHCIRSVVVSYFGGKVTPDRKPKLVIDVYYRTTELLRKFGADLIFLHDFLLPKILADNPWGLSGPHEVRLHFSTCFFSALFIPVFFQFVDPVGFLVTLKHKYGEKNQFYKRSLFRTKTMLERDASHYKFRSRRNMQELAMGFLDSGRIDKEKLKIFIKEELE